MKSYLTILLEKEFVTLEEKEFFEQIINQSGIQKSSQIIISNISTISKEDLMKSKIIIASGNATLEYLLGIKKIRSNRGKKLYSEKYDCKVIPTLSIAETLNSKKKLVDQRFIISDLTTAYNLFTEVEKVNHNYVVISGTDREGFDRLITKLHTLDIFSFDIEVDEAENWDVGKANLLGIGFSWKIGTGVYVVMRDQWTPIPKEEYDYRIFKFKELFENLAQKIAHQCGYEIFRLQGIANIKCKNLLWDTLIMHHLWDENKRHGLDQISDEVAPDLARYKEESEAFLPRADCSFIHIPTLLLGRRCCGDSDLTLRLATMLKPELEKQNLMPLYQQIAMPHRYVLTAGEIRGVRIDIDELNRIDPIIAKKRDTVLTKIRTKFNNPKFNPRSWKQIQDKILELVPQPSLNGLELADDGKPRTHEANLTILANRGFDFSKDLIYYKQLAKLHSTYIEGIRKRLHPGNILNTSYLVHGTVTGRLSSRDPNLQNMPTDSKLSDDYGLPIDISIRKLFIPREGYKFIVSDGSQMELRILATITQDPLLIKTYKEGGDVHEVTALEIIPGSREIHRQLQADPENKLLINKWDAIRRIAKTVNFGIVYGCKPKKLASELGISFREAQIFLENFMEKYPGVYIWIQQTIGFAKRTGYVPNLFGRKRRLIEINSPIEWKREEAERQGINSPIQGSAGDCTAIANIRIMNEVQKRNLDMHFLINVHDELVHEVHESCVKEGEDIVRRGWLDPIPRVTVPLDVSIEVGDRWQH
jgi:DNA polymerase-1